MIDRKPCLAEEWFVDDGIELLNNMDNLCREKFEKRLQIFNSDNKTALSEIYKLSRSIRVQHIMAGRFEKAREIDNWYSLEVMLLIETMIDFAENTLKKQKPNLFPEHGE